MQRYNPKDIEPKWQKIWEQDEIYRASEDPNRPKRYVLEYFPYPSGAAMHVGHVRNYTIGDAVARFSRMQGFNVMHPMGWDAFGLPAENYAIKNGISPQRAITENTSKFKKQLMQMGFSYDWSREINSSDPSYYKWTQWFFTLLFERGLAYQKDSLQWWCDTDQTVLANEQVEAGKCWRCGNAVTKKPLKQWFFKITDYADRLSEDLDKLDWSDAIKSMQRNWIGKSKGAEVDFAVADSANYVLLHGYKSSSKTDFHPWLKAELEKTAAKVYLPDLPNADDPDAVEQAEFVLSNYAFDENTVIVAHSYGSVTALRILEKLQKPIKKLVIVQGFTKPGFNDGFVAPFEKRSSWEFDYPVVRRNAGEVVITSATNDSIVPSDRAEILHKELGGTVVSFIAQGDHACGAVEPEILRQARQTITVFTTRADTLFGATFMVLAPEHPLVQSITTSEQRSVVDAYIQQAQAKSDVERQDTDREKTGVFTGAYAINPVNNEQIPVWIADYVLYGYGTGAIMAVPAHDERDHAFAKKFDLPIRPVVAQDFGAPLPDAHEVTGSVVIAFDPNQNKFAGVKTGTNDGLWLMGGGSKSAETFEQTAIRELAEESGFRTYDRIVALGEPVYSYYFNDVKKRNTRSFGRGFLFYVDTTKQQDHAREPHENFEINWYSYDELYAGVAKLHDGVEHWLEMLRRAKNIIDGTDDADCFHGDGVLVDSGAFSGSNSAEAREEIVAELEKRGVGREVVNYKIRDWLISRQRYWGAPIPIIHCPKHGAVPVPKNQLPVVLPEVESYQPTGEGTSVLAGVDEWVNTTCPTCGGTARRETDTMDGFACSSWYFLRFADPNNAEAPFDPEKAKFWLPVDDYIGGAEHAVMHLLYARMWTKVMFDAGMIDFDEPFRSLRNQGMILAPDGRKMSKSWGNTITPDDIIEQGYGADAIRIMELFIGPWNQAANWSVEGMGGCYRFLQRYWALAQEVIASEDTTEDDDASRALRRVTHQTIKKVTADMHDMGFNTAIAAMMELVNELYKLKSTYGVASSVVWRESVSGLTQLLAPFAPHITEEIWQALGNDTSVHRSDWPHYDPAFVVSDTMKIVVQVNGKLRATIDVSADSDQATVESLARAQENVRAHLHVEPKRVIYVPKKLLNFVV